MQLSGRELASRARGPSTSTVVIIRSLVTSARTTRKQGAEPEVHKESRRENRSPRLEGRLLSLGDSDFQGCWLLHTHCKWVPAVHARALRTGPHTPLLLGNVGWEEWLASGQRAALLGLCPPARHEGPESRGLTWLTTSSVSFHRATEPERPADRPEPPGEAADLPGDGGDERARGGSPVPWPLPWR